MSNKDRIAALPTNLGELQRLVLQLQDTVASHEEAKRARDIAAQELAASPALDFAIDVLNVKTELEALADGAEDYTDPRTRSRITGNAGKLLDRMLAQLQAK
jgi:hypothetical protein